MNVTDDDRIVAAITCDMAGDANVSIVASAQMDQVAVPPGEILAC